ncbi:MAG: N-acetylmuramoyl-L-alanine amidase [Sphingobacteriia bacterium]|nr:N-acetylmuramoyl-L-alanine amidase [Sphingobacteriia bacterium]
MKNLKIFLFAFLGIGVSSFTPLPRSPRVGEFLLVIDAGHGGKDPGCHGVVAKEKQVALSIALELEKLVKSEMPEVQVIMTRKTDVFVELHERAKHASLNKADFFISIHCNANPNPAINGTETYAMGLSKENANLNIMIAENSVIQLEENYNEEYEGFDPESPEAYIMFSLIKDAYLKKSLSLATQIETEFKTQGRKSRGAKQGPFLVLWRAGTPSILVETGFLTHKEEEKFLYAESGQKQVALGIFNAFQTYTEEKTSPH